MVLEDLEGEKSSIQESVVRNLRRAKFQRCPILVTMTSLVNSGEWCFCPLHDALVTLVTSVSYFSGPGSVP